MSLFRRSTVMGPLALSFLLNACSPERPPEGPTPPGEPAPPVGSTPPVETLPPLWRADDQRVSLSVFGHNGGSFQWTVSSQFLTPAHRAALSGLKRTEDKRSCLSDLKEYFLSFEGADGTRRSAFTREDNASCGRSGVGEFIDVESLRPLLDSLQCVGAYTWLGDLSQTRTIRGDDGCWHGLSNEENWLKVVASRPERLHTFTVSQCFGSNTQLDLFDASGTELLARAPPGSSTSASCPTLTWRLDAGTVYALRVRREVVSIGGHALLTVTSD